MNSDATPCSSSSSTTTDLHSMASPSSLWSTDALANRSRPRQLRPKTLKSLGPYVQRSTGLSHFNPGPQPVARSGRNPRRRSSIGWSSSLSAGRIHSPSCTQKDAVFQGLVTHLPSRPTRRRSLTLGIAPFPSDWRLPLAAAVKRQPRTSTTLPAHCYSSSPCR